MLTKELETAVALAREAGALIMEFYENGFEIEQKPVTGSYSEPVTAADRESSRIIVSGISEEFSGDAVLSEEEPDDVERRMASRRVWITDPLDGTKGFTEKEGDFAVQIALLNDGIPVLGVVFQPIADLLYYAVKDRGAHMVLNGVGSERLGVSETSDFKKMTIAVSRSHRSPKMSRLIDHFGFRNEYRHGSVGLKVGFLARRLADIYIHLSPYTKFWDTAAPQVILEEAGGVLTDLFGRRINYLSRDVVNHDGIFSCNAAAHKAAIAHLKALLREFGRVPRTTGNP